MADTATMDTNSQCKELRFIMIHNALTQQIDPMISPGKIIVPYIPEYNGKNNFQKISIDNNKSFISHRRQSPGRSKNRRKSDYFRDTNDPNVDFCQKNIDVSNFLNMHSKTNHQEFCLA